MIDKQPGAAALWFNSLFNNERLERGQSTVNLDLHAEYQSIQTHKSELEAVEAKLQLLGCPTGNEVSDSDNVSDMTTQNRQVVDNTIL